MYFSSIEIENFRNLEKIKLKPCPGLNLFIGQNGQGKTNVVEAIFLAINGQSFRTGNVENLISLNSPNKQSYIRLIIHSEKETSKLEVSLENKTKKFRVNSKPTGLKELSKKFPSVLFAPESLSAIKRGPEERRTLLDEVAQINDLKHVDILVDFLKTLKQRNAVLKEVASKGLLRSHRDILEILDNRFVDLSVDLVISRLRGLQSIEQVASDVMAQISNKAHQKTSMGYIVSGKPLQNQNSDEIRNALRQRMGELRDAELSQGSTLAGPHRHDLQIFLDQMDSRQHCSQGQQRALILSIKISQVMQHFERYGRYPILLLDDVLSELDAEKRAFLLGFLKNVKTQTFITSTESSDFKEQQLEKEFINLTARMEHSYFTVQKGRVEGLGGEINPHFAQEKFTEEEFGNGRGTFVRAEPR